MDSEKSILTGSNSDEGISGTSTRKRDGFNRMVADALAGKIGLILTKSVSRFARNTVDSLSTIRELKAHGTEVYFEKENIWTFDSKGELLITLMSSLAQEESRSISENVTWGQRKRMADGRVTIPYKHFLGYRKGPDGLPEIVPEEAMLVQRIYRMFIEGISVSRIAKTLTDEGIPTPAGKQKWQNSTIESILTNEKYKGDARLQKKFTTDFLTKKMKVNEGEVPQYYVRNSHPAIIEPEAWDQVQKEMQKRKANPRQRYCSSPFSGKILCGDCGCVYGSKVWHSTDQYRRVIWQCNGKFKGDEKCTTPHLTEDQIKLAFREAVSRLISDRTALLEDGRILKDALTDCTGIDKKLNEISQEMEIITGMIDACVRENAVAAQDQDQYKSRYDDLINRFETLQAKQAALQKERAERERKGDALDAFLFELSELDELDMEFSPQRWNAIVDHVTVHGDGRLVFIFHNGSDVMVEM
jgi:Site-specific recombinases, DNA invertase Pin homologs